MLRSGVARGLALVSRAVPRSAAVHTPALGRAGPSASFTRAGPPRLESEANHRSYDVQDVVRWLEEEHAFDVCYLEVTGLMDGAIGDWLVFGSARTEGHMKRTAKAVVHELKKRNVRLFGRGPEIEGGSSDEWMLVDGGSIIVNVMMPHARAELDLEHHWQKLGAPMVQTESRHGPDELAAAAAAAGSGLDVLPREGEPDSGGTPAADEAVYAEGEGVDWRGVEELQRRRREGGAEASSPTSAEEAEEEAAGAERDEGSREEYEAYEEYEEYGYDDDDADEFYDYVDGDDDFDGDGDYDYDYDYDYYEEEGEGGGEGAKPKASGDGGGVRSVRAAGGGRASR